MSKLSAILDGPVSMKLCGVFVALLALAGCQNVNQFRFGTTDQSVASRSVRLGMSSNSDLCNLAIERHYPQWDMRYLAEIEEVKRRGLTEQQCARSTSWYAEAQIASTSSTSPNPSKPTTSAQIAAQTGPKKLPEEAAQKRKGRASNRKICEIAMDGTTWDRRHGFEKPIAEAKRRGLTELQCAQILRWAKNVQNVSPSASTPPNSEKVGDVQRLLISLGHLRGRADGVAGPKTITAINSFQKSQKDSQTGNIDDELIASLKLAEQERIQSAKMNVAKSLVQLREEQRREQESLRKLREEAAKTRKELADASKARRPNSAIPTNISFGEYHALVIGINKYRNLPKLRTAVADAEAIGDVLKTKYGFKVTTLIDPTRETILQNLGVLRAKLKFSDNLLIYYAGHGWLDEAADEGYWQPSDAKKNQQWGWVSNASITTSLRAIKAKHVMVMADSCYSGKLTRGANTLSRGIEIAALNDEKSSYLTKMAGRKTRVAMTSGNLEPVEDGQGKHSPFARAILNALNENKGVIDGTKLHNAILTPVVANTNQTPQYRPIKNAGHSNGNFLFVRRK